MILVLSNYTPNQIYFQNLIKKRTYKQKKTVVNMSLLLSKNDTFFFINPVSIFQN